MLSHQQSSGFRNPNLADYASSYYMALAPQLMQVIDRQKQELATLRASNSLKKGQEKSDDPPDPLNTELGGEGKESVDPLSGSESVLAVDAPSAAEYGTMTHPADNQKSQSPNYASGLEVLTALAADEKYSPDHLQEESGLSQSQSNAEVARKVAKQRKHRVSSISDETTRVCTVCGTSSTPKWRCGTKLCNACGLRVMKKSHGIHKSNTSSRFEYSNLPSAGTMLQNPVMSMPLMHNLPPKVLDQLHPAAWHAMPSAAMLGGMNTQYNLSRMALPTYHPNEFSWQYSQSPYQFGSESSLPPHFNPSVMVCSPPVNMAPNMRFTSHMETETPRSFPASLSLRWAREQGNFPTHAPWGVGVMCPSGQSTCGSLSSM
ncbi:hypothetical protein AB1Y20_015326 [Prymnesium parvum]|uniref:GATA-type domain-containing protein n=1 Tax=Prymnesium parvum TaxID=97485 RepID=A0AB34K0I5_PRYPA